MTRPTRSRAFWEERYGAAAASGASLWGTAPNGWIAEQVERLRLPPGAAVDLGAGQGRNALWLAARGWRVTAVDFAESATALLRAAAAGADVTAVTADATAWTAARPVDLAVLCYLQLPPEDLVAAIGSAARALRPGGLLIGIWHDREDVARGVAGSMSPIIRTTPEETAAAAGAAGLAVELSGRRDRAVAAGIACDCLLIARRP